MLIINDNSDNPITGSTYLREGIPGGVIITKTLREERQEHTEIMNKDGIKVNPLKNLVAMIKRKFK